MTEEDNLQKTVIAELRSLRNDMERIAGFIVEMRRDYSVWRIRWNSVPPTSSDSWAFRGHPLPDGGTPTQSRSGIYHTRVRDKKRLEKVGNLVKNSYLYR